VNAVDLNFAVALHVFLQEVDHAAHCSCFVVRAPFAVLLAGLRIQRALQRLRGAVLRDCRHFNEQLRDLAEKFYKLLYYFGYLLG